MARKKVEVLEGEIGQLKSDLEGRFSYFQNQISTNNKRMEGKLAIMEEMLKKLIEVKTALATSEARGNLNRFRGRENPKVEILEGEDGIPPLEPPSREEISIGIERTIEFIGKREDFYHQSADFERGRRESDEGGSGERFDTSMALCDAKVLYEAVTSSKFIDHNSIISIMNLRNIDQIKTILSSFKHLFGHEFIKFLKYYNSGEFGIQLRAVIRCIQFPEKHFAKQLRRAMVTGDSQEVLIRTLVTRSGIDIKNIDSAFSEKTGWSLESLIRNEFNCSSHENSLGWTIHINTIVWDIYKLDVTIVYGNMLSLKHARDRLVSSQPVDAATNVTGGFGVEKIALSPTLSNFTWVVISDFSGGLSPKVWSFYVLCQNQCFGLIALPVGSGRVQYAVTALRALLLRVYLNTLLNLSSFHTETSLLLDFVASCSLHYNILLTWEILCRAVEFGLFQLHYTSRRLSYMVLHDLETKDRAAWDRMRRGLLDLNFGLQTLQCCQQDISKEQIVLLDIKTELRALRQREHALLVTRQEIRAVATHTEEDFSLITTDVEHLEHRLCFFIEEFDSAHLCRKKVFATQIRCSPIL
ncbi:hypothetical protein M5K25_023053 [Dendrobium thyrsiflorum]|uniref:Uncharacterized protein n=1 Tax=Dendrobium thyrsiflorum TaxID=117978 RepID=A0ABD0U7A2_DENTH